MNLDPKLLASSASEITIKVMLIITITFFASWLLDRIKIKFAHKIKNGLLDVVIKPVRICIFALGLFYGIDVLNEYLKFFDVNLLRSARALIIIGCMMFIILNIIDSLEEHLVSKHTSKIDKTTAGAIAKILKILTAMIIAMFAIEALGFSVSGLIALAGGGGVAIGFASKDIVANFFGALMIYMDKPFKVGDWIKIPEKNLEGFVDSIALRCTVIKSDSRNLIFVPNSVFSQVLIENHSRLKSKKFHTTIQIRHEDIKIIRSVQQLIEQMLASHLDIDSDAPIIVSVSGYTVHGIGIYIAAFSLKTDLTPFFAVKNDVIVRIGEMVIKANAQFAKAEHE